MKGIPPVMSEYNAELNEQGNNRTSHREKPFSLAIRDKIEIHFTATDTDKEDRIQKIAAALVDNLYQEQKRFNEFLLDARKYPNLTAWETNFISSLHEGFQRGTLLRFEDLTPKMLTAAKKIRSKLYAM